MMVIIRTIYSSESLQYILKEEKSLSDTWTVKPIGTTQKAVALLLYQIKRKRKVIFLNKSIIKIDVEFYQISLKLKGKL